VDQRGLRRARIGVSGPQRDGHRRSDRKHIVRSACGEVIALQVHDPQLVQDLGQSLPQAREGWPTQVGRGGDEAHHPGACSLFEDCPQRPAPEVDVLVVQVLGVDRRRARGKAVQKLARACTAGGASVGRIANAHDNGRFELWRERQHVALVDHQPSRAGNRGRAGQRLEQSHPGQGVWAGAIQNRQWVRAAARGRVDDEHARVIKSPRAAQAAPQQVVDEMHLRVNHLGGRVIHATGSALFGRKRVQVRLIQIGPGARVELAAPEDLLERLALRLPLVQVCAQGAAALGHLSRKPLRRGGVRAHGPYSHRHGHASATDGIGRNSRHA
jgi:hypothetical protein